jgi:hypothetical protein
MRPEGTIIIEEEEEDDEEEEEEGRKKEKKKGGEKCKIISAALGSGNQKWNRET